MAEMSEEMKKWMEENLAGIPAETRWAIAAQTSTGSVTGYDLTMAEVLGMEKWPEIHDNMWGEGGKMMFPQIKKAFNIPVENAIDAGNLSGIVAVLRDGPEYEWETVEESPKRVVTRITKCPWWNRLKEFGAKPEHMVCASGHERTVGDGLKAVNPKIKHTLTKAMPRGDPYCEVVYELEE